MTAAGKRPLPGAEIFVDISIDVYQAFTKTDDLGRFFLCRINSPIALTLDDGLSVGIALCGRQRQHRSGHRAWAQLGALPDLRG